MAAVPAGTAARPARGSQVLPVEAPPGHHEYPRRLRVPHPSDRRTILAALSAEGLYTAERASTELAGIAFGLPGISAATASRITADLRTVRQALGDLG
jgi:hypothetical protein